MTETTSPPPPRPLSKPRSAGLMSLVGLALALVVIGFGAIAMWLTYGAPQMHVEPGAAVRVRIDSGFTTREIGQALVRAGVVPNANGFVLRSRLAGADARLKPGVYDMRTGMPYGDALRALEAGPTTERVSVTIPEGFRVDQIADRFSKKAGVSRSAFLALALHGAPALAAAHPILNGAYRGSLEGYLFPKTYEVSRGAPASAVVSMMLDQFDRETGSLDLSTAEARGITSRQVVVIASMIERESKLDRERPLVSAVIYNRLRLGRRLKIDATIEYVLRDHKLRLTNQDLYTASPYNTYLRTGLPPGPISNPGAKSLQAAAHPARSGFLYYVLTGKDGSHTFTTNLADFLVAKRKSKEVFGQ